MIRGPFISKHATFWLSTANGRLTTAPPASDDQAPGHLFIHTDNETTHRQVWVLNGEREWVVISSGAVGDGGEGFAHPTRLDRYFKFQTNGKPSWVKADTLRRQGVAPGGPQVREGPAPRVISRTTRRSGLLAEA